jgi:hypothetical protein
MDDMAAIESKLGLLAKQAEPTPLVLIRIYFCIDTKLNKN